MAVLASAQPSLCHAYATETVPANGEILWCKASNHTVVEQASLPHNPNTFNSHKSFAPIGPTVLLDCAISSS
eukprot:5449911-Amphidinium_carterae.1